MSTILQTIRGYGDPGNTTVTIPSVNVAKTEVRHEGNIGPSMYYSGVRLLNSTQIQCIGVTGQSAPSYEITERS